MLVHLRYSVEPLFTACSSGQTRTAGQGRPCSHSSQMDPSLGSGRGVGSSKGIVTCAMSGVDEVVHEMVSSGAQGHLKQVKASSAAEVRY